MTTQPATIPAALDNSPPIIRAIVADSIVRYGNSHHFRNEILGLLTFLTPENYTHLADLSYPDERRTAQRITEQWAETQPRTETGNRTRSYLTTIARMID